MAHPALSQWVPLPPTQGAGLRAALCAYIPGNPIQLRELKNHHPQGNNPRPFHPPPAATRPGLTLR